MRTPLNLVAETKKKLKMTIPDEVDIIVCGGGSAGCVVAGRYQSSIHMIYNSKETDIRQVGESGPQSPGAAH